MIEPIVVQPATMKSGGDCAICCLAMLLGKTYADILTTVPRRRQVTVLEDGLTIRQMKNIGKKLGFTLVYQSEPDEDDVGILDLDRKGQDKGHVVMWMKGIIYNPSDGEIWTDDSAFLIRGNWEVSGFLWREQ